MVTRRQVRSMIVLLAVLLAACSGSPPPTMRPPADTPSVPPTMAPAMPTMTTVPPPLTRSGATTPSSSDAVPIGSVPPPVGCSKDEITHVVERFIAAFNQGDQAALARFFGPRFMAYSVGQGDPQHGGYSFVAESPQQLNANRSPYRVAATVVPTAGLLPYFMARHAHGERLGLRMLAGNYDATLHWFNMTFQLVRTADDIPPELGGPEHLADGKGAIDCTDQTIMGWTMSQGASRPGTS